MRTTLTKLNSKYATGKGVGSTLGKWKRKDYIRDSDYICICKQQKVKSTRLKEVKRSNHTLKLCFKFKVSENIMSITLKRTPTVIKKLKLWKIC